MMLRLPGNISPPEDNVSGRNFWKIGNLRTTQDSFAWIRKQKIFCLGPKTKNLLPGSENKNSFAWIRGFDMENISVRNLCRLNSTVTNCVAVKTECIQNKTLHDTCWQIHTQIFKSQKISCTTLVCQKQSRNSDLERAHWWCNFKDTKSSAHSE